MGWEERMTSCRKPLSDGGAVPTVQRQPQRRHRLVAVRLLVGLLAIMLASAIGVLAAAPHVAAAPVQQASTSDQGILAIVGANSARLYATPGGEVTDELPPGTVLTAVGRTSDSLWVVVYNNTGVSGWVEVDEVVLFGLEQLPVMVEGAAPAPGGNEAATPAPPLLPSPTATPTATPSPPPSPTPTVTPTPSPTPPPTATPTALPTVAPTTPPRPVDSLPAGSSSAGEVSVVAVVRGGGADLYDRPDGTAIQTLETGTALTAWGRSGDGRWVVVTSGDGAAGWVQVSQVVIFNVTSLPVLDGAEAAVAGESAEEQTPIASDGNESAAPVVTSEPVEEAPEPVATAVPTVATEAKGSDITASVTVTDSRLNIRTGPGTEYAIVGKATGGSSYPVVGRNRAATWIEIASDELEEGTGWVSAEYVTLSRPILGIPVSERTGALAPTAPVTRAAGGLTGRLVFQSVNGGMIYVYDLATGTVRELTGGFDPAISPDGSTVAFTRIGGDHGLYLIDIDGSNERRIWNGSEQLRAPTWSPDGQWIAFVHTIGEFRCRDLGFGICLPTNPFLKDFPLERQPEWGLSRVDYNGENYRDLPALTSAQAPDWTPTGIVYQANSGIEITDDTPQATTRPVIQAPWYQDPSRQPNGDRVVFQSKEGSHWEIFSVNVDGSGLVALTKPVTNLVDELPSNVAPAWSPDGKWIVYLSNRDDDNSAGPWRLWVMDADGGNQRPLPIDVNIDYSYSSEQVVSWGATS